jgi:hypothetical protein
MWIDLAQYRDKWWALVNAVMNLCVPYNAGNFLTEDLLASKEGLCFTEVVGKYMLLAAWVPCFGG